MIEQQPKSEWAVLPRPGCKNVEFCVLLAKDGLAIANLRFSQNATIDRHSAPYEIDVVCVSGNGFVSIDDEQFEISMGETVRWPADHDHCLWTEDSTMETLMVERTA